MVSMRFATLDCKLAGTSCTTETIPTIRMALARIISSTEKPFWSHPVLVKSLFAFTDCILGSYSYIPVQEPPLGAFQILVCPIGMTEIARNPYWSGFVYASTRKYGPVVPTTGKFTVPR